MSKAKKIPSLNAEEAIMFERLRSLKMSAMAERFADQMQDPNADLVPFFERFSEIVNHEWETRYNKKFSKLLKEANLRYQYADLDKTIYDPARKTGYCNYRKIVHMSLDR